MKTVLFIASPGWDGTDHFGADFGWLMNQYSRREIGFTVLTDGDDWMGRRVKNLALIESLPLIIAPRRFAKSEHHHINDLVGRADYIYVGIVKGDEYIQRVIDLAKSVKKQMFLSYDDGHFTGVTYNAPATQLAFA